ncbi:MAG: hypothetical protein AAFQ94_25930 [Bacteroidota bacterium]
MIAWSCTQTKEKAPDTIQVNFSDSLSIFAEGLISTPQKERDLTISPDGQRILFTKTALNSNFSAIVELVKSGESWSAPAIVSFSGKFSDLEPAFSPDGKTLFFASNRPAAGDPATDEPVAGNEVKDFDIWKVELKNGAWGNPVRLDTLINKKGNEFYPTVSKSGNLYYTASYDFENRKEDIYMARWNGRTYDQPAVISDSVNTKYYEFNAFVDPDEQFILYSSFGRPGAKGGGDLYISYKDDQNRWLSGIPLAINSPVLEYCPFVTADKKYFFFTSNANNIQKSYPKSISITEFDRMLNSTENGNGDIWIMPFEEIVSSK